MTTHDLVDRAPAPSWSNISTSLLLEELTRRQADAPKPECRGSSQQGDYNIPIHVGALLIILFLSTAGCAFPIISKRVSKSKGTHKLVFFSQHFGTGVLIATAFVHLLPTAFISLTDPCLPWFFNEGYEPLAGVIAMVAVLIVVGIEMFLRTRGVVHSHSHAANWDPETTAIPEAEAGQPRQGNALTGDNSDGMVLDHNRAELSVGLMNAGPWTTELDSTRNGGKIEDYTGGVRDGNESDLDLDKLDPRTDLNGHAGTQTRPLSLSGEDEQKRLMLQCLLLEAGILFHSVFIGMALSVATGTPFVVFLIAISFHQAFEGMALGSRIAAIKFPKSSPKPWLMVLAYGLTTPIGQAIGLGVHTLYDPKSQTGLLMVGIMNAISSGLLLFAGLVQLLAEDFLSDGSYGVLQGKRRLQAYFAVILGAALMALVGAWA